MFPNAALADATDQESPLADSTVISQSTISNLSNKSEPYQLPTSAALLPPDNKVASPAISQPNQEESLREETTSNYHLGNNRLFAPNPISSNQINQTNIIVENAPNNQLNNNIVISENPQKIAQGYTPLTPTQEIAPSTNPYNYSATPSEELSNLFLRGNSSSSSLPYLTTAHQLLRGEVLTRLRYRQSFPPDDVASGLTGQPTIGFSWGITNGLEITLDAQTVDNEGPGRQGAFRGQRTTSEGSGNFFQELTLQAKQRIWENAAGTQALSGVVAISRGVRAYTFNVPGNGGNKDELVPSLELPYTVTRGDRWQFTLSPKVAFLPEDNALYFRRPPVADPGSFGTTFGLAGGASYRASSRLLLWGDTFFPFAGNNTIDRDTGLPSRAPAFNAGLRYLVNPRLAIDLFVSNSLGNVGALSMVVDKEYPFLGFGITFLPGITNANRRYPASFGATPQPFVDTPAGFAFLDGGTVRGGQLLTTIQGGGQGLLAAVRFGLLDDLEIGSFIDLISGTTDESEFGFSGKIRFFNQAAGDALTVSVVGTLARSNNVLINLINNNANEFEEQGLEKGGFAFSNEGPGELFIITLSAPMHYQLKNGGAIWLTPTLGFVQRNGVQIAGLNFGISTPLLKNLDLIGEIGLELSGKGNAFVDGDRETVVPWNIGLRWNPSFNQIPGLELEAYATNRVGSSPFHSLRVQADKSTAISLGVRLPVQ